MLSISHTTQPEKVPPAQSHPAATTSTSQPFIHFSLPSTLATCDPVKSASFLSPYAVGVHPLMYRSPTTYMLAPQVGLAPSSASQPSAQSPGPMAACMRPQVPAYRYMQQQQQQQYFVSAAPGQPGPACFSAPYITCADTAAYHPQAASFMLPPGLTQPSLWQTAAMHARHASFPAPSGAPPVLFHYPIHGPSAVPFPPKMQPPPPPPPPPLQSYSLSGPSSLVYGPGPDARPLSGLPY
jgi:hypothetical protein